MDFRTYWRSLSAAEKKQFAANLRHNQTYLIQVGSGFRQPSPRLAKAIHAATQGAVQLHELRPDIWDQVA